MNINTSDNHEMKILRDKKMQWALGINRMTLRAMGAWPDDNTEEQKFTDKIKIPLMILSIMLFMVLPQCYALIVVINDFPLVIDNLMSNVPSIMSCLKLAVFWLNKDDLHRVIRAIGDDWLHHEKSTAEYETMRRAGSIGRVFTISGYLLVAISFLSFALAPLCGINVRLFSNATDIGKRYQLIVQSCYPFDYANSPILELLHLSQVIGGSALICAMAVPDHYFGVLVFHFAGQYELLGSGFENVMRDRFYDGGKDVFKKKLGLLVERHVHLIRMVKLIEKSFSLVVFSQLGCLFSMACCIGFRILYAIQNPSDGISFYQILNLLGGLVFILLFTLNDCAAGEALSLNSSELFRNIYNSKWYMHPKLPIRDLTIIMAVTKKPQVLKAGYIVPLSMFNYCSIVKSIVGYISVLIAVNG